MEGMRNQASFQNRILKFFQSLGRKARETFHKGTDNDLQASTESANTVENVEGFEHSPERVCAGFDTEIDQAENEGKNAWDHSKKSLNVCESEDNKAEDVPVSTALTGDISFTQRTSDDTDMQCSNEDTATVTSIGIGEMYNSDSKLEDNKSMESDKNAYEMDEDIQKLLHGYAAGKSLHDTFQQYIRALDDDGRQARQAAEKVRLLKRAALENGEQADLSDSIRQARIARNRFREANKKFRRIMRKFFDIVRQVAEEIENDSNSHFKVKGTDFTRNRKVGALQLLRFILQLGNDALRWEINRIFRKDGRNPVYKSTISQARQKLKSAALDEIFYRFNAMYHGLVKWKGIYVVLGFDGSSIEYESDEDDDAETAIKLPRGAGYAHVQHLNASCDIMNGTFVNYIIQDGGKKQERTAFRQMMDELPPRLKNRWTIATADRGYEAFESILAITKAGVQGVIRIKDIDHGGIMTTLDIHEEGTIDQEVVLRFVTSRSPLASQAGRNCICCISDEIADKYFSGQDELAIPLRVIRYELPQKKTSKGGSDAADETDAERTSSSSEASEQSSENMEESTGHDINAADTQDTGKSREDSSEVNTVTGYEEDDRLEINVENMFGTGRKTCQKQESAQPCDNREAEEDKKSKQLTDNKEEYACLVTTISREELTFDEMAELYHLRWGIETNYRFLKCVLHGDRFHSRIPELVRQEIAAKLIVHNVSAICLHHVPYIKEGKKHEQMPERTTEIKACWYYIRNWGVEWMDSHFAQDMSMAKESKRETKGCPRGPDRRKGHRSTHHN